MQRAAIVLAVLLPVCLNAENVPTSDPLAVSLAQDSVAALSGGVSIVDVTLDGNAISFPDSASETGSITLKAKGATQSRVDLNAGSGTETDIRTTSNNIPGGSWAKDGGPPTSYAQHNCWTDSAWFFPVLSSLSQTSNPKFIFKYIGETLYSGVTAQHIRIFQTSEHNVDLQRLSTIDFYLDAATLLPLSISFNTHSDSNESTDIPITVNFSNYQPVNGIQVPFHIRQFENGTATLDITLTSVSFNTGLTDTLFTLN